MSVSNAPVPPQNLDAEESVLGAMLMSPKAIDLVVDEVRPEHFYRESHNILFRAALALHEHGQPVDAITIADFLERHKTKDGRETLLEAAGGRQRLHELASLVPAWSNAKHYAKIVRGVALARALIGAGQNISRLGWEMPGSEEELLELAEKELTRAAHHTNDSEFKSIADNLDELTDRIEEAVRTGVPIFGLKTGLIDLDRTLLGLHPGQLILVAARPAMGKSAFAQNIGENVADHGGTAAFFTLEMSDAEVQLRALSRAGKIDSQKLRQGLLTPPEFSSFQAAKGEVKARERFFIEDSPGVTPSQLRAHARRLHRQKGIDILIVDYLQLMISGGNDTQRNNEVSDISRSLKLLARELNIPVVALSQLNRNLESRAEKRPQLSDLRDSGSLEQDADVVLFLYRDDYYFPESDQQGIAEVIVAKQRMGPTDTVKLAFVARHNDFRNLAKGTP